MYKLAMSSESPNDSEFIEFACVGCRGDLRAVAVAAGRLARCPLCNAATPIPADDVGLPNGSFPGDDVSASSRPDSAHDSQPPSEHPQPSFSRAFGYVPPAVPSLVGVGDIVGRTWDIFFHRFLRVMIVVIVTWLLTAVALTVGLSLDALAFWLVLQTVTLEAAILVALIGLFPALLPALWVYVGQLVYLLKLARGHRVRWYDVLRGGPYVVNFLHAAILIGLLALVGLILCVVPGMIVLAVFAPAWYLMVERELKPIAAMKTSWRLIRGNFVHILLVMAVNLGVATVAELVPCGVGQLFAVPFIALLWTVTYLRLTGQATVTYEYEPSAASAGAGD
jgi:hypothetical protein